MKNYKNWYNSPGEWGWPNATIPRDPPTLGSSSETLLMTTSRSSHGKRILIHLDVYYYTVGNWEVTPCFFSRTNRLPSPSAVAVNSCCLVYIPEHRIQFKSPGVIRPGITAQGPTGWRAASSRRTWNHTCPLTTTPPAVIVSIHYLLSQYAGNGWICKACKSGCSNISRVSRPVSSNNDCTSSWRKSFDWHYILQHFRNPST